jgi:16S rRNA (guanine1516-N2)-methyltransferase
MIAQIVEAKDELGQLAKGLVLSGTSGRLNLEKPVIVDFLSGKMRYRLRAGADHEFLVKAIGLKKKERVDANGSSIFVCDFTAGLGTDAFLLAQAGYQVLGFERDALIFELLQDGLRRYREYEFKMGFQPLGLEFRQFNTAILESQDRDRFRIELVAERGRKPYAVVMDPMFETHSTKSKSKPKKEMSIFREILAPSTEAELSQMLETALLVGQRRVLVKRAIGAPAIQHALKPTSRREAKTAAYDIYTCREVSS